ncbi:hypothetical protein HUW62_39580 [Myxococcus sp. AM011]|uniref:DUF5675 family protein n=1 Tax=Myxococcus sp. AM011 TaxID=2745200 RepID=UPI001595212A|nr:DUF5675 family protein [Myxococcus sp. AM011]NVJ27335.1 hypothetical protein [Myxococcus sp. AM011]
MQRVKVSLAFVAVLVLGGVAVVAGEALASEAPLTRTIEIRRSMTTSACRTGYLLVDGMAIGYTLEPGALAPDATSLTSIPNGDYDAFIRVDKKKWRLELKDVPRYKNAQIHIGNDPKDTAGCVLVGLKVSVDQCRVTDSAPALKKLQEMVFGETAPRPSTPVRVKVLIRDESA